MTRAMNGIANDLQDFEKEGILRGNLSAKVQTDLISGRTKLEECVKVKYCTVKIMWQLNSNRFMILVFLMPCD